MSCLGSIKKDHVISESHYKGTIFKKKLMILLKISTEKYLRATLPGFIQICVIVNRRSNISAHVLLNLIMSCGKVIKCEICRAFNHYFAMNLINSIIQEHFC